MLERYFIRPTTVDRIRACWIGDAIERYVIGWQSRAMPRGTLLSVFRARGRRTLSAMVAVKRCSMKRKSIGSGIRSSLDCVRTKTLEAWQGARIMKPDILRPCELERAGVLG